jgi:hypothetical protein
MDASTPRIPAVRRSALTRVALYDPRLPDDLIEWLWMQPESLVGAGEKLQCKAVRQTVRLAWGSQSYVLKHYAEQSRRHYAKQLAARSRARRTWNVTHRMADAGILTPRPVACVENRWGPFRRDSFLLYPYVEGATLRTVLVNEALGYGPSTGDVWRQVHQLWQRLRHLRASLSDTNMGNFIVCPDGQLWVIDLDKARFFRTARTAGYFQKRAWQQLLRSARASVAWETQNVYHAPQRKAA